MAEAKAAESDELIPYFIRLQRLGDDVSRAYGYDDCQVPVIDALRIEVLSGNFNQRLHDIKTAMPRDVFKNRQFPLELPNSILKI